MYRAAVTEIIAGNLLYCRFNGKGCGHEDSCKKTQNQATDNCGIYPYLEYLDKKFPIEEDNK